MRKQRENFFTIYRLHQYRNQRSVSWFENLDSTDNAVVFTPDINEKLLKALVKATVWERQLRADKVTLRELTQREGVSERYVQHILRLNFLAPDIKEAILEGRQPERLSVDRLRFSMPLLWEDQWKIFGFSKGC